jgi:outer membrane protein assembly factor BamB
MSPGWTAIVPGTIEGRLATDGSRIFVATTDGTVRALSRLSGAILWEIKGRKGPLAANAEVLVVREPDGTIWSIDPATGSARWKVQSNVPGTIPPAIFDKVVLVAGTGAASLRVQDGTPVWTSTEGTATTMPVGHGPYVFVGEKDGALRCRDSVTGTTLWTFPTGSSLVAPPLVDERDRILLGTTDRRFLSLDLGKGTERWTWKLGADVHMPAAVLGSLVLFTTHEDVLYALERSNGHMAWRASLPSRPLSGPLLHGGAALVACYGARPGETFVVGFDGRTGKRLGDLKAPGEVQSAPLVLDDRVILPLRPERNAFSDLESTIVAMRIGAPQAAGPPPASPAPATPPPAKPTS